MRHISSLHFLILAFATYEVCVTQVASFECGTINFTQGLIWNGKRTVRGEWPFLTALFKVQEEEDEFFCGGSLISSKHVLTAAHCIQDKSSSNKRLPGEISVLLGAYNLTSKTEIGVQQRNVTAIHAHTEWDVYTDQYDADLAVLLLSEIVIFTDYIRPVCLPADDTLIDDVRGSVVGWGLTELGTKPNTEFIKRTFVSVLNGVYCLTKDPGAAVISSVRTFCGRGEDGNANRGDSGGGFYVENQESVWVQHGIVSALRTNQTGYVNADSVVVYANVAKFKKWIVDTVMQSGAEVGQAKSNIKLNLECTFGYDPLGRYICFVDNLNIRTDNIAVASFSGSHLSRKTDQDVELIVFRDGTMYYIPSGVGQIFKNVKLMGLNINLGTKRIKRTDFKDLQNLVEVNILMNDITTLDYDSFRDLQQLEVFAMVNNRLTAIDGSTFDTNIKLREVYLHENKLAVLPSHLFRINLLLESVDLSDNFLRIIDESTFETNIKLKEVFLYSNELEFLPSRLFQNNSLLETVFVGNNSLKQIDESTFEMNINLREVYLFANKLELLPKHLFKNNLLLESVELNNNSLKIIDESTFEMNIKLKKISLHGNKLEFLPKRLFKNNSFLEIVSLNGNSLKLIDESTFEMNINLREVYLSGNKLDFLPKRLFKNNSFLEIVELNGNSLKLIDESTFEMNINLREVYLYGNELEVLPKRLFRNNLLLKFVYLNDNSLKIIDESTFETNTNVKQISLYGNKLEFLPRRLFQNNSLLEFVFLNKNSLRIIDIDFTSLRNIKNIFFYDNICINAFYQGNNEPEIHPNEFRNLTEFNSLIRANCSSPHS